MLRRQGSSVQITWQSKINARKTREFCTNRLAVQGQCSEDQWILYKSLGVARSVLGKPMKSVQITWWTVRPKAAIGIADNKGLPKPTTQVTTQWQGNWEVAVNNKPTTQGTTQLTNSTQLLWSKLRLLLWMVKTCSSTTGQWVWRRSKVLVMPELSSSYKPARGSAKDQSADSFSFHLRKSWIFADRKWRLENVSKR